MKRLTEIMKILAVAVIAISICASTLYCQDSASMYATPELVEISNSIQSPEDLSSWLDKNFHYEMKFPDKPKQVAEVLFSRTGDCDDLANLSSQILSNMNVENKVLIIKFKGISMMHAVCVFRAKDGCYNFMSNKELIYTKKTTIESAVAAVYPDFETYEEAKA